MNTSQDIKMQMVDDNVGNQVRHNAVQNDGNEVGQNAVQNLGIQIVENMNGLSVVSKISNQYGNRNVVTAPAEGNGNGINGNLIRCYNCGDGSTEVPKDENCYDHDIFNMLTHEGQYTDLQTELDRTTKGTRTNTMFTKQSILGKPPSSSYKPKLYFVTPSPKSSVLPKVDKTNALSKPVTLNSAPSTRESKDVQSVNGIARRIFRTNPSKTSWVDNVVPNKPVKTSVRIKPITFSQPNVIHNQQVNSNLNDFSSSRVNNTAKTRRPHPRSNYNTDRVPSKSKSSCLSNKIEKIGKNHMHSQISKNQKHMSSECNNITLAIRNAKPEIVCVRSKQYLVTANHDVCVLIYVNDMNSRADNQSANI
uniref:Uncharacterized protein n=1 Tax=Tanacetum cinerariifolium TaxID=118510 RepID=A0A699GX19_TANCI|nr:hypothetical protein [Tanacetum cinerariifolium]